jgi:FKBP-type peptidyl-prolyl cis-trans isomerase FkpA
VRRIRFSAIAGTILAVAACAKPQSISPTDPANQVIATATFDPSLHVDLKASTQTASGLYYRDVTVGTGPVATAGQRVAANYDGWTVDGKEFDSSASHGPYPFVLGAHAVIAGWDEGVAGMHVGGKRQLIIPASLGYGPNGNPPAIPPNAVLVFSVELVSAQ